jgi:hypothetical protein
VKIRLMGSPDLVRAWSREIERAFAASCAEYPCRGSADLRAYCDIDDRKAADFGGSMFIAETVAIARTAPSKQVAAKSQKKMSQ